MSTERRTPVSPVPGWRSPNGVGPGLLQDKPRPQGRGLLLSAEGGNETLEALRTAAPSPKARETHPSRVNNVSRRAPELDTAADIEPNSPLSNTSGSLESEPDYRFPHSGQHVPRAVSRRSWPQNRHGREPGKRMVASTATIIPMPATAAPPHISPPMSRIHCRLLSSVPLGSRAARR